MREVILHCDGQHFTLLQYCSSQQPLPAPDALTPPSVLGPLLERARRGGCVVMECVVEPPGDPREASLEYTLQKLIAGED